MGTSKRYGDRIDQAVEQRQRDAAAAAPPPMRPLRDWTPPWPPIRIGGDEWIIMRDSNREPVGIIRTLKMGPRNETFYRVVTWAARSEQRELVGYFRTIEEADRSILFNPQTPRMPDPPFGAARAAP